MSDEYFDNLYRFQQKKAEEKRKQAKEFYDMLGQWRAEPKQPYQYRADTIFIDFNMPPASPASKAAPLKSRPPSKEERRIQIEHELDIIKGRIPTPKGYKIDKLKIRALIAELKRLQA